MGGYRRVSAHIHGLLPLSFEEVLIYQTGNNVTAKSRDGKGRTFNELHEEGSM
jgi:hypothetical protein